MRDPKQNPKTGNWTVRYRVFDPNPVKPRESGSEWKETSKTFRLKADADTFAALMGDGTPGRVVEALNWLERKQGNAAATELTFGTWVEAYIDQLTGVTSRTRDDYRVQHRNHLGHLDALPLVNVNRTHVTNLVNTMEAEGRAPKTIKNVVYSLLSPALDLAVYEGKIDRNPTKRVRLPAMTLAENENEARFLTYEDYAALDAAVADYYRPLVQFLIGTGLRWSEATALQKRHVDLEAGTVRVQQAWKKIKGGWEIGPPKAKKSRRTVNAATSALVAVAPLIEGRKSTDTVFVGRQGGYIRHGNFYGRVWVPACEKAGLDPRPRIHDLRHTHASWLISSGVQLEAIQDQLGHQSIETTRRVYGHLLPAVGIEVGRQASAAMDRALAARAPKELT